MARNNRTAQRAQAQAEIDHASEVAHDELVAADADLPIDPEDNGAVALPGATSERAAIYLGHITDMMAQLPPPAMILGQEVVASLKARGVALYRACMDMASYDVSRYGLAYTNRSGEVRVKTMGLFMQSQARGVLTQAFYALRTALREEKRRQLLDQSSRLARQTDWQSNRPGQEQDGISEATWVDGDDRYDPVQQQADRAQRALEEALPFVAAAFLFCERVPGLTDGAPIQASVKRSQPTAQADRPQTSADRYRAAEGKTWVAGDFDLQRGEGAPTGDPELQEPPAAEAA